MGRPAHNKAFKDIRPPASRRRPRDRRKAYVGAQYSNTLQRWIPFMFDGAMVHMFEPKGTRERAWNVARAHMDRMFHPEGADRAA